jgi:hypothetical protein
MSSCIAGVVAKRFREEDEPESVKRLKLEIGKASPSTLAFPDEFQKITGPNHAICCNRPFEMTTIPLVLLHEAFGLFKDRCLQRPSGTAMACLTELALTACKWYRNETERRDVILNVLSEHLNLAFHPEKVPQTEYTTDGNLIVIVMPPAARECKNEAGHALNQIILYYSNYLKLAHDRPQHFYNFDTRFPCILLVDMGVSAPLSTSQLLMIYAGPHFAFYGAVWDGERVRVESLIRPLDLATHWMESESRSEMASSFDALMLAVNNIQAHYEKIKAEAHATPAPKPYNQRLQKSRKFPFVTSYIDGGQETTFTYVERLDEQKLLFSAFVNGGQQDGNCIVKFTQRYSEAAHLCLASYNSAPTLRHCNRISTTWTAVVMDRSTYTTLYGLCLTEDQQEKVRRKVGETLQVLHDAGFVHGDLRDTNILIDLDSLDSNDVRIHFVDFDWAGRIGEAKYPDDINRITVRRPEGIEGGKLITMEHDKAMLSYLFT